jgi:Peptidase inhibitor I78 family
MKVLALPLLLAAACAPTSPPGDGMADCSAIGAQALVGRQGDDALGKDGLRRTGARTIRWIRPGQAVTMDYRTDRLNIEVDESEKVIRITCG